MKIYQYADSTEDLQQFLTPVSILNMQEQMKHMNSFQNTMELDILGYHLPIMVVNTVENRRSFRSFELLKSNCEYGDVIAVTSVKALGLNEKDIVAQLDWFIERNIPLIICDTPSTYEYGLANSVNRAVLSTIRQSLVEVNNIVLKPNKHNAGRPSMKYPENWEELYEQWENKNITSKEFMEKANLKKATFYNLLSDYKKNLELRDELNQKMA
ncbi:hypothetical protein [Lachnospira pectinoschiza]|uniref:Resolvase n=1 Tax=Lachnospira pectinoschiza TaxID=28052 RepID=A0A1G9UEU9_9FIRM|nr:hypothetical protein [Lachnospira pectinoschiza]SDM58471.1 hypothetical protein SAMN05216544_0736 [Lachnospira pectinoschiza]